MKKENLKRFKGRPKLFNREDVLINALNVFWKRGFEPASISELCNEMKVKPSSLYATFGSKAKLFMEVIYFYENKFWKNLREDIFSEPDFFTAIEIFFSKAIKNMTQSDLPHGCMIILSTINLSSDSNFIFQEISSLRKKNNDLFIKRVLKGIDDGQINSNNDPIIIASSITNLLEGLSIQAHNGMNEDGLKGIVTFSLKMLK